LKLKGKSRPFFFVEIKISARILGDKLFLANILGTICMRKVAIYSKKCGLKNKYHPFNLFAYLTLNPISAHKNYIY
jgi:hypothetical protein